MTDVMIISDPNVTMGKLVVAGTRITVELILEELGAGENDGAHLGGASTVDTGGGPGGLALRRPGASR